VVREESQRFRPDLARPETWADTLEQWRADTDSVLDLGRLGSAGEPVPTDFLALLPDSNHAIGRLVADRSYLAKVDFSRVTFTGEAFFQGTTFGAATRDTPADLAILERNYRDLRRQLEATSNTHGANDFYAGEMEARRRQLPLLSGQRWILELYRAVSFYGTRVIRAVVAWQVLVLAGAALLLANGISIEADRSYRKVEVWRFALEGSLSFFRPTTAPLLSISETLIMIGLRILGPVMLALAALAVRNQTKR
jgi:hypothetical protein